MLSRLRSADDLGFSKVVSGLRRWSGARAIHRAGSANQADVLLVCSAGGHLLQLHLLSRAWQGQSHLWVTHDKDDSRSLLEAEPVVYAYGPTTRNVPNLMRNLRLALRVIRRTRPQVLITTGAGLAVPFGWIGRSLGVRVVYIESFTRIDRPSLSCRLVAPVADRIYVQWPELTKHVRRGKYVGNVLGS